MPRRRTPRFSRLATLMTLAVVGVLALAFSYAPPSVIDALPPELQQAVEVAQDARERVADLFAAQEPRQPEAPAGALPNTPRSFTTAKRILYEDIYAGRPVTFYCGCDYDTQRQTDLASCGMAQYAGETRADRVEAEHVFPASQFGNFRKCWREPEGFDDCYTSIGNVISGRDCCGRVDPVFEAAHNDLHNLFLTVGMINGDRSNFNWGMVPRSSSEEYGACEIRIDSSIRRVQPADAVRVDIARTLLYMADTYGFRLSRQDEQFYNAWNRQDPPDTWEIERNRRIEKLQGLGNRNISDYAALAGRSGRAM